MAEPTPSPQRAIQAIHERRAAQASLQAGGRPPFDGPDLEPRVQKLEDLAGRTFERLAAIEQDVAVIRASYVTQGDLHKAMHEMTWKIITFVSGFGTALVSATFVIARYVR